MVVTVLRVNVEGEREIAREMLDYFETASHPLVATIASAEAELRNGG